MAPWKVIQPMSWHPFVFGALRLEITKNSGQTREWLLFLAQKVKIRVGFGWLYGCFYHISYIYQVPICITYISSVFFSILCVMSLRFPPTCLARTTCIETCARSDWLRSPLSEVPSLPSLKKPRRFCPDLISGYITHRIHGAAIYGNMDPINIPPMFAYIPAPWILWVMLYHVISHIFGFQEKSGIMTGTWDAALPRNQDDNVRVDPNSLSFHR